jgi:large-conductance mechanosensitive channel
MAMNFSFHWLDFLLVEMKMLRKEIKVLIKFSYKEKLKNLKEMQKNRKKRWFNDELQIKFGNLVMMMINFFMLDIKIFVCGFKKKESKKLKLKNKYKN